MAYLIKTPCGIVQGTTGSVPGVVAFKGIRYATAGRWEYPKQVTAWEGVYDASQYGPCCWQERAFQTEEEQAKSFYYKEFREGDSYTYSEDCLFLNIWIPQTVTKSSKLPVLVYIHGGAYQSGCGHEKPFRDPVWPTRDIIAVTINYRVGPLGFACFEEASQEAGHAGNYGLYDQMTALQWIQDNISAFGGDPRKVTVMGQSAGAMSVQHHCLSPMTYGLFSRAVINQKTADSFALASADLAAVKQDMCNRIALEAERRCCADNSIINYANATFYPKMVADVTVGTETTAQTLYNPIPDCGCKCGH